MLVTSVERIEKSCAESTFPPYISVIRVRRMAQGMDLGAMFVRLPATWFTHVSMMKTEHSNCVVC